MFCILVSDFFLFLPPPPSPLLLTLIEIMEQLQIAGEGMTMAPEGGKSGPVGVRAWPHKTQRSRCSCWRRRSWTKSVGAGAELQCLKIPMECDIFRSLVQF